MPKRKHVLLRRILSSIISLSVIGGISFFTYNHFKNKKQVEVPVYKVEEISYENYYDNPNTSDGVVREVNMQSVYASDTEKIEAILVSKGQRVNKGDKLLSYSTFLTDLAIERKDIEYQRAKLRLSKEKDRLREINDYTPYYKELYEPDITEVIHEKELTPPVGDFTGVDPIPLTGNGIEEPYLVLWDEEEGYTKDYIYSLFDASGSDDVTISFMSREDNTKEGKLLDITTIAYTKTATDYTFKVVSIDSEIDPLYWVEIIDNTRKEPDEKFTKFQINKLKLESQKNILLYQYEVKSLKYELDSMKQERNNSAVYATISGVVEKVRSINEKEKPIIVVSAGGGLQVNGKVNETNKDKIKVGMKVEIESMMSGQTYEGKIDSISNKPSKDGGYSYGSNPNSSYYPYTVKLPSSSKFSIGDWVNLKLIMDEENTNEETFFIYQPFVLEENNRYYVYVSNKGHKLEKREIYVGKNMDGALEVLKGLSREELVAFPYGKNIKNGVNTKESSTEELYSSMY